MIKATGLKAPMNPIGILNALKKFKMSKNSFEKGIQISRIAGVEIYNINCVGRAYGLIERAKLFR
jgi:hypothetical protein